MWPSRDLQRWFRVQGILFCDMFNLLMPQNAPEITCLVPCQDTRSTRVDTVGIWRNDCVKHFVAYQRFTIYVWRAYQTLLPARLLPLYVVRG